MVLESAVKGVIYNLEVKTYMWDWKISSDMMSGGNQRRGGMGGGEYCNITYGGAVLGGGGSTAVSHNILGMMGSGRPLQMIKHH